MSPDRWADGGASRSVGASSARGPRALTRVGGGRAASAVLGAAVIGACGDAGERVELIFPDAETRASTTLLAVTVFEPLVERAGRLQLQRCQSVTDFEPFSEATVDRLRDPGFGRVFFAREGLDPAEGFDHEVDLPELPASDRNPWGLIAVLIEARGDAAGPPAALGAVETVTLASGCFCLRTLEGTHQDLELDAVVKAACAPPDADGSERTIRLEPILPRAFDLELCGTERVIAFPGDSPALPGPAACLRGRPCPPGEPPGESVDCVGNPGVRDDLAGVPVQFDLSGPGVGPARIVTVTDDTGRAEPLFVLERCEGDFEVTARVLGRGDEALRFQGRCALERPSYECAGAYLFDWPGRWTDIATLPGPAGGQDAVALLMDGEPGGRVVILGLRAGRMTELFEISVEESHQVKAIHGFHLGPGADRPVLVIASSVERRVVLTLFEWTGTEASLIQELDAPCPRWTCGALTSCSSGCPADHVCLTEEDRCVLLGPETSEVGLSCEDPPARCGCALESDFDSVVSLRAADLDGDGLRDLVAASSRSPAVTSWYATGDPARPYQEGDCRCGRYGVRPWAIALPRLGGPPNGAGPETHDLVLGGQLGGSPGSVLSYGRPGFGETLLACGSYSGFGDVGLVRALAVGRFSCRQDLDPSCPGYEDLVVITSSQLSGPTEDPGFLRVIFGNEQDISQFTSLYAEPGIQMSLTFRGARPADPRAAEVGDLNGDGHDDLVVNYPRRGMWVWLGLSNRALGGSLWVSPDCPAAPSSINCSHRSDFALADLDGNGRPELVAVCIPVQGPRQLRWHVSL